MDSATTNIYEGALYLRELDDGRVIVVYQMAFTARLCIGPVDVQFYDDGWCYPDTSVAIRAAEVWDGEGDPTDGWIKQLSTGRRRVEGNPALEYVEP